MAGLHDPNFALCPESRAAREHRSPAIVRPPDPGYGRFRIIPSYRADPIGVLADIHRRCGDIATFRLGPHRIYPVNHPDLIGDVLVTNARKFHKGKVLQQAKAILGEGLLTSEDEFHRRQRRLVQPAFQPRRIDAHANVVCHIAREFSERWTNWQTVDMAVEMQRLTLDVATATFFGVDLPDEDKTIVGRAVADAMSMFDLIALPSPGLLLRSPLPAARRFRRGKKGLHRVVTRLIEAREADGGGDDLLSRLLAARDDTDGTGMTERQLEDETTTILLAGHETTAQTLAWTWTLLAQNPEAEACLHNELESTLGGRPAEATDIPRLPYCERVLLESLRLYPTAWALPRLAVEDHELAGYRIPAGSVVVICLPLVHRDPRWWHDPDRFDPERWMPGVRRERPRFAFLPFGAGPRVCIGSQFAMMSSIVILATLAQRWRARLIPGQKVEVETRFTLRPKGGLPMTLERRER